MIRILIILMFCTKFSFSQSSEDYKLYSKVIDSFIQSGVKLNVKTAQAVVMSKFIAESNPVSSIVSTLKENKYVYELFGNNLSLRKLLEDSIITNLIVSLDKNFFNTPKIDKNKFNSSVEVKTIKYKNFRKFFKGKRNHPDHGWKNFYSAFPGSGGIFEFSKIVYDETYACFYSVRSSGSLSGRGDIIILQKENDVWNILGYLNLLNS